MKRIQSEPAAIQYLFDDGVDHAAAFALERLGLDPALESTVQLPEDRPDHVVLVDSHSKVASPEFIQHFLDMSIYIDYLWLIHSEAHTKIKAYDWLADKYRQSSDVIKMRITKIERK
jgi:hypothetical protein